MRSVLKEEMGKHHAEMVNKMLLTDCSTVASNNFESLDRITAAEASNGAGSATTLKPHQVTTTLMTVTSTSTALTDEPTLGQMLR